MKYDFLILGFGEINKVWTNPQWTAYTLAKKGFKAFLEALGLELDTKNSGVSIATPSW